MEIPKTRKEAMVPIGCHFLKRKDMTSEKLTKPFNRRMEEQTNIVLEDDIGMFVKHSDIDSVKKALSKHYSV